MRRLARAAVATVALAALVPSSAQALRVRSFTAQDSGTRITYLLRLCVTRPSHLRFRYAMVNFDDPSKQKVTVLHDRTPKGCFRYNGEFADTFSSGLWVLGVTITDDHHGRTSTGAQINVS